MRQFEGLRVALTGVFSKPGWGALSVRKELELELEAWGAVLEHPLTRQTDLLVLGARPSGPTQRRAHAYGIETITLPALRADLEESTTRHVALARLRALAREEPSEEAWARVAIVVERWPDLDSVDVAVDYVERYLRDWPHELRVDRYGWFTRLLRGQGEPRARLVRHAGFSAFESDGTEDAADNPEIGNLAGIWINASVSLRRRGLGALLASPYLSELTHLSITHCDVGDDGIEALTKAETLPNLRHLTLSSILLGPVGAAILANAPRLDRVTHLDLSSNIIGDLGARALASGRQLGALRWLDVSRNHITDVGASALALSPHLAGLESLEGFTARHDQTNSITRIGARAIVESPHLSQDVREQQRRALAHLLD